MWRKPNLDLLRDRIDAFDPARGTLGREFFVITLDMTRQRDHALSDGHADMRRLDTGIELQLVDDALLQLKVFRHGVLLLGVVPSGRCHMLTRRLVWRRLHSGFEIALIQVNLHDLTRRRAYDLRQIKAPSCATQDDPMLAMLYCDAGGYSMRPMSEIVKNQKPLTLGRAATVKHACECMRERRVGAVLVTDGNGHLLGIFTGRDAVCRMLAEGKDPAQTTLADVMTHQPDTMTPGKTAIEALRLMRDGGYRHLPVVEKGKVVGVVSKGDFHGDEQDRLDEETGIWERL